MIEAWKKLPWKVATTLGPHVVRGIPYMPHRIYSLFSSATCPRCLRDLRGGEFFRNVLVGDVERDRHPRHLGLLPRQRGRAGRRRRIVAAAQEERFTRKKHDPGFPDAGHRLLPARGRPDAGAISTTSPSTTSRWRKFERLLETYLAFAPRGLRSFRDGDAGVAQGEAAPAGGDPRRRSAVDARRRSSSPTITRATPPARSFPARSTRRRSSRSTASASGARRPWASGAGNRIELTHHLQFPHSLGLLYSAFTYYCGFKVNSGEYKLMGLAPYGQPVYRGRDLQAPDRPQARRQLLAGHGLFQLLPGADDDEPAVPPALRRAAARARSRHSSSGTWIWRPAFRR